MAQKTMQLCWEYSPNLGIDWIEYGDTEVPKDSPDSLVRQLDDSDLQKQFEAAQRLKSYGSALPDEIQKVVRSSVLAKMENRSLPRPLLLACASAFVALGSGVESEVSDFWRLSKDEPVLRRFAENALIRWRLNLPRGLWLARLEDASVSEADLLLALRGLAATNETSCIEMISRIVEQEHGSRPLLLQACEALGQLATEGQESLATKCLNSSNPIGAVMAARIIINHTSSAAHRMASQLIDAKFQPARRLAFQWLSKNAPQELSSMLEKLTTNEDSGVRMLAIELLCKANDSESVRLLGGCFRDDIQVNRRRVRDGLIQLSQVESLAPIVLHAVGTSLGIEFGPGSEEAIETVVALKATQFNAQLLDLLDHKLPQIRVRAAWGLQELGEQEPEHLDFILNRCLKFTQDFENKTMVVLPEGYTQWAYLLATLGKAKHKASEPMLRKYVAKSVFPAVTRTAGIWSLGRVLQGSQDSELAKLLAARMMDNGQMGEDFSIRYCSTLAIGFIASPASEDALKGVSEHPPAPVGKAAEWALSQLDVPDLSL